MLQVLLDGPREHRPLICQDTEDNVRSGSIFLRQHRQLIAMLRRRDVRLQFC